MTSAKIFELLHFGRFKHQLHKYRYNLRRTSSRVYSKEYLFLVSGLIFFEIHKFDHLLTWQSYTF
jgi:hypothetical protein